MKFAKYVGTRPQDLPGGRVLAPEAGPVEVDENNPIVADLFDQGKLIEVDVPTEPAKLTGKALQDRAKELDIEGRNEMNADQLRDAVAAKEAELASQHEGAGNPPAADDSADTEHEEVAS